MQRRHQKVVEVAPAVAPRPQSIREELCAAAVALARKAGYRNAGTVEFLFDADANKWYFIEVNPRIQVEHTVTEMVTGIDLVQAQIRVAEGHTLHEPPLSLPKQADVPLYGSAIQCRVTTEDTEHNFAPDYGKLTTYRSPAGFGIRLDGGTAYAGASLSPYYDSLLVKITAWHTSLEGACHRMDRALREFRIRGVKTNILFLENVIGHPRFQRRPDHHLVPRRIARAFPAPAARRPRHQAPALHRRRHPQRQSPGKGPQGAGSISRSRSLPKDDRTQPPPGTRQLLQKLGPRGFAEWARKEQRLLLTDTTFRDAHQSLLATRVRTYDLLPTAPIIARRLSDLFSLEVWGGATFDTTMRFLYEDPWQRLRELRRLIPNICFQMLTRGANAVGYASYPPQCRPRLPARSPRPGHRHLPRLRRIQLHRQHARLDRLPARNRRRLRSHHLLHRRRPRRLAPEIQPEVLRRPRQGSSKSMGAHFLCIKDMAGVCKPPAAVRPHQGPARGNRHPRPLPHARHQRHQLRFHSRRPPTPAWTSWTPPSPP